MVGLIRKLLLLASLIAQTVNTTYPTFPRVITSKECIKFPGSWFCRKDNDLPTNSQIGPDTGYCCASYSWDLYTEVEKEWCGSERRDTERCTRNIDSTTTPADRALYLTYTTGMNTSTIFDRVCPMNFY